MNDAAEVRDEDSFDVDAVAAWLGRDIEEVRQFAGGASNLTYLLKVSTGSTNGPDLILRRPPAGTKAKGAHDMGREYRIQSALAPVFPYVAPMVAFCEDESVIGSEFYVMERVAGHIPRKELGLDLTPEQVRALCTNVLDLLVDLHGVDPEAAGLTTLGKGEGYVARQVGGWIGRFGKAKTWNVPSYKKVMRWLDEHQPADRATCLIHNDFRFDNVVLDEADPTKPIALLDWEMATLGDPLMDLGAVTAYWVQADDSKLFQQFRRQPTHIPGMLSRREVVDYYLAKSGFELTDKEWAFYEVFGMFRLAVILQQIYYRYHHKQTSNPAFKNFWIASHVLHRRCLAIIKQVG
ncbi:phosphotransferase family protein [Nocardioides sp. WS12]|uniref:phosphotransferase family protein n=1 Tax=Nocardioides sp. WS12 TaxID=2486272 RepID=UPI0015F7DD0A|nr:phosphotransferase family protein [Nocardioides sp. WS12]